MSTVCPPAWVPMKAVGWRDAIAPMRRMQARSKDSQPAYKRIQRSIQEHIQGGKLKPGDVISSERQLARQHGVSLMTARNALSALEKEGLVERRRGAGTFVAVPKIDYNQLLSTTELMGSRGVSLRSRVLSARRVSDQPDIAAHLALPTDAPLVRLERLRLVEQEPIAIETSYLSAERFGGVLEQPLENGSLFTTVESRFQVQISYSEEEIDATAADRRAAKLLGCEVGSPVLRIRQTIHSTSSQPIMYVLGLYRSDTHKMHVRRTRR